MISLYILTLVNCIRPAPPTPVGPGEIEWPIGLGLPESQAEQARNIHNWNIGIAAGFTSIVIMVIVCWGQSLLVRRWRSDTWHRAPVSVSWEGVGKRGENHVAR